MKLTDNLELNRYQWAEQTIRKILDLDKKSAKVVYDVGGRDGIMKEAIVRYTGSYIGFDLAPLSEDIHQWDIDHPLPYSIDKADIVVFLEVLEHLKNPWNGIKNISESLKKDGYLILTTPNPCWSRSRISLVSSGYLDCFTKMDLELNHHVFTPWPHIVERLLNDNQLKVVEYVTLDGKTNLFAKPINLKFPFAFLFRLINRVIEIFDSTACGMSYGIIAQKK